MTYYLLLEGDSEKDAYYDSNVLGEESFGMFYTGQGMVALNNIVNQKLESARHIWTLKECCEKYKKHLQNKSHRQVEYEKEYRGS